MAQVASSAAALLDILSPYQRAYLIRAYPAVTGSIGPILAVLRILRCISDARLLGVPGTASKPRLRDA